MSLRSYTFHVPASAMRSDPLALDQAKIVPDGFVWGAFAFSPLWFVYHRLWLAALGVLAFLAGLGFAGRTLGLAPFAALVSVLLALLLIGLEASSLRRWTYGRSGRPARDVVIAQSFEEAEVKATSRWLAREEAPKPSAATQGTTLSLSRRPDPVIGLFPLNEGGR